MTDETPNIETAEIVMGSFQWALIQLRKGRHVRRRTWQAKCRLSLQTPDVILVLDEVEIGVEKRIRWDDILAYDWEIFS